MLQLCVKWQEKTVDDNIPTSKPGSFCVARMSLKKKQAAKKSSPSSSSGLVLSNSAGRNGSQGLPEDVHGRLWELFRHIEKEFEVLHAENVARKWPLPLGPYWHTLIRRLLSLQSRRSWNR